MANVSKKPAEQGNFEVIIENVGKKSPKEGDFYVEVQISEEIRIELMKAGVELSEKPVEGLFQNGVFIPDMRSVSDAFTDGDPAFCIEAKDDLISDDDIAPILFEGMRGIRAEILAVLGDKSKHVAYVRLISKKEKRLK
jgi:hypothetical protein